MSDRFDHTLEHRLESKPDDGGDDAVTSVRRIELITGEWIGLEDVKAYSCYVDFAGSEYFRMFPARPPRGANRDLVMLNSRVLVVGRVVDVSATPTGAKRVLVDGIYIRSIE